ncbi:threonine/homoserine/homoserine lactone efflux protein [Breoghania corrubedonensis]|uniref:Threonine/homoserine/homoserine lactone efflux protein n=1 Tax=Breoghania corrubedonensis TaxID=665038 RepID=A0A2T5VA03_9HYPH|nr:LysE family translocator [Breoghania corrubedonensis]PTW60586.1 threonine/homoserine/homoserine lactone efflux protein [Breoghania corrubedonensis]
MIELFALFALTEIVMSASPGPAVFLVLSKSLRHGARAGLVASAGILGVNVVFFILSAAGLGVAIAGSQSLYLMIKFIGAAYLAWSAWEALHAAFQAMHNGIDVVSGRPLTTSVDKTKLGNSLLAGITVQASSIKNLVIFLAIIPQFIDPSGAVVVQFAALCLISVLVELPILAGYALLASYFARRVQQTRFEIVLNLASGVILLAIAGMIVFPRGGQEVTSSITATIVGSL